MIDIFSNLATGFSVAFSPMNILFLILGVFIGMIVGIFPGFGPTAGIAILLPLTFDLDPTTAIIMLAGIYYGSMYGGAITSILINTPGDSGNIATLFDGYPLARKGRAGPALVMQAVSHFIGGMIAVVLVCALAPTLAKLAFSFGPSEYFLIIALGLLMISGLMGDDKMKGIISALFGLALATVGVDVISGFQRFTFGSPQLIQGIDFVPVAIGLFGIGELFYCVYTGMHKEGKADKIKVTFGGKGFWPETKEYFETKFSLLRGTFIGFFAGVLPGSGATLGSLMAYSTEKKVSKHPERFGKGEMAGLVAPEAANNAATAGAMVPMLTIGIPGSASTAVMLGALLIWGLTPGPLLFTDNPELAWGTIVSMFLGNMALILINIVCIPLFIKVLDIPYRLILPAIVVLCVMGTYVLNGSIIETWIMLAAGVVGFFMKLHGYSPGAVVLALVLGSQAENSLLQSFIVSDGTMVNFVTRPISQILLVGILVIIFAPIVFRRVKSFGKKKDRPA